MDIVKNRDFVNEFLNNLSKLYEFSRNNHSNEDTIIVELKRYNRVCTYRVIYGEKPLLRVHSCFYTEDYNKLIETYATKETNSTDRTIGNSFYFDIELPSDTESQIALFMKINRKFEILKIKL